MSELTRDLELNAVLASGVAFPSQQRSESTNFQQRRTVNASGVVISTASAKYDTADGKYGISDYYQFQATATGVMQVNIRDQNSLRSVIVLDSAGTEVMTAEPSKLSRRNNAVTTQRIGTSGTYYMYIQTGGRNSAEYRIDVDILNQ
jgi:hypothetical protein